MLCSSGFSPCHFWGFFRVLLGGLFGVGLVSLLPLIEQHWVQPHVSIFYRLPASKFFLADVALIFWLTILLSFFSVIFPAWRAVNLRRLRCWLR